MKKTMALRPLSSNAAWLPIAFLALAFLLPVALMVARSFEGGNFQQYQTALSSPAVRKSLLTSVEVAVVTTAITTLLGLVLLWALEQGLPWMRKLIFVALLLPFAASGEIVRIISWLIVLSPEQFLYRWLLNLGVIESGAVLVPGRIAVVLASVHLLLPFFVFTLYSSTRLIDKRVFKAAVSLGSSPTQAFATTTVPMMMPAVASSMLLIFILQLGYYATPNILGGPGELVAPILVTRQTQQIGDWGQAAALGTLLMTLTVLVLVALLKFGGLSSLYSVSGSRKASKEASWRSGLLIKGWMRLATSTVTGRIVSTLDRGRTVRVASRSLGVALTSFIVVFLALPVVVVLAASLGESRIIQFPPDQISTRWYEQVLTGQSWTDAIAVSMGVGVQAAVIATVLGFLLAYAIVRGPAKWKAPLFVLGLLPLVMPWIVTSVGMYFLAMDAGLAFTQTGLAIGHAVGAIPFAMIVLVGAMSSLDERIEKAAQMAGAAWLKRQLTIVVPLLLPATFTAFVFTFVFSLTEVPFALLMSGGGLYTLPVLMWQGVSFNIDPSVAAAGGVLTLLVLVILAFVAVFRRQRNRQKAFSRLKAE